MSNMRYKEDFVERTINILEKEFHNFKDKDREVTFLLNCLLGLIVTVSAIEKTEKDKFLDEKIDDELLILIPKTIGFVKNKKNSVNEKLDLTKETGTKLKINISDWYDLKKETKKWLLGKIRNGISHLNIEWENDNEKIKAIKLWNKPFGPKYAKKKDFEISFEIEKLKKFAIEISQKYLFEKSLQHEKTKKKLLAIT